MSEVTTFDVEGVVKWYDTQKGFGFVSLTEKYKDLCQGKDVMVHKSCLRDIGLKDFPEGAWVSLTACDNGGRLKATKILKYNDSGVEKNKAIIARNTSELRNELPPPASGWIDGSVKFYNPQGGFGFIQPEDASEDIMIHAIVLKNKGYLTLRQDDKVKVIYGIRPKGKMAVDIKVL